MPGANLSLQHSTYNVATPIFQGPLDLLLHLIERAELDITKLALAQVTEQYLSYIQQMPDLPSEEVSGFLVIASRLILIKSEVLLPRPPVREEGEEDPGEALAMQLLNYRRYKRIASWLAGREEAGLHTYLRLAPPVRLEGVFDLAGISIDDLVDIARVILTRQDAKPELRTVVTPSPVTIREKIGLIYQALKRAGKYNFLALLKETNSRIEIVVTFLALLELIKRHQIQARQEQIFGEIQLEPAQDWEINEDFELEFGE